MAHEPAALYLINSKNTDQERAIPSPGMANWEEDYVFREIVQGTW